jgi:hypothetical protein
MGHINFDDLFKINRMGVREMFDISKPTNTLREHFLQGKKNKTKFKSKEYSTTKPLDIVHRNCVDQQEQRD